MGRACDHAGITANSVASIDWIVGGAIQPRSRAATEPVDRVALLLREIKKWQGGLMYTAMVVALLAVVLVTPVHAQVHVDIGIHFPAPPPLVVVPETPRVQYVPPVPAEPANLFFYNGQYWAFADGGWYVSSAYDGPWIVVAPEFVPRPVLLVPTRYYHVPPEHWRQWDHHQPPRWHEEWGREWAEKREWRGREHERDDDHDEHRGRGRGRD